MDLDLTNLDDRQQKAVDVASTYIQVLIGLSSGIITAVLAFYPEIQKIAGLNFLVLKFAIIFFGISIVGGLVGLGGLVNSTANSNILKPTDPVIVRAFVLLQLVGFAIGIVLVIYALPW